MFRLLTAIIPVLVPVAARDRLGHRLMRLLVGLVLYGVSLSLLVLARLGIDPWDVFQQGLARHTGIPIGTWVIIVSVAVICLWIPLRQRPALGTLLNVIVIGTVMDLVLAHVTPPTTFPLRMTALFLGVGLNGVATGLYIGAGLGPGPRDGLMVGLAARGLSIRLVRTAIEVTVLVIGWRLGGNVSWGTLLYALAIGPLAQMFIPRLAIRPLRDADPTNPVASPES